MKSSRRAKRMQRHHKRHGAKATLSLVSLMDIFTILVFFLLVNSNDAQKPPDEDTISLPLSTAEQLPSENLVIMVNGNDIIVQGRKIADAQQAIQADEDIIAPLKTELEYRAEKQGPLDEAMQALGRPITIMGDKKIPYQLLKKIMLTCSQAEFSQISLAVIRKPEKEPSA